MTFLTFSFTAIKCGSRGGGGGDRGSGPPPWKITNYMGSIGNKQLDPPWKKLDPPPGKCWTPPLENVTDLILNIEK